MSDTKQKYQQFCEENEDMPLFLQYHWIDCVANDDEWGVSVAEKGELITGVMPYFVKKKAGFSKISHPPLTPYMGPWVSYPEGMKYAKRIGHDKKVFTELFNALPRVSQYHQRFYPLIENWLPFYWMGCTQTTRYTYVLEDLSDLDKVFKEFKSNIRRAIKKADRSLSVDTGTNIEDYFRLMKLDYTDKGEAMPYSEAYITKLFEHCHDKDCGRLYYAKNESGEVISTLFLVWDKRSSYYLAGATDPKEKSSGASSLLLWKAIQDTSEMNIPHFNFEGSMIEPIENFFRAFGGKLTPFNVVEKTYSTSLKWKEKITG